MHTKNGVNYYGKDLDTLDANGVIIELEWMQGYFNDCERDGQGISTKEAVYFRKLKAKLAQLAPDKVVNF